MPANRSTNTSQTNTGQILSPACLDKLLNLPASEPIPAYEEFHVYGISTLIAKKLGYDAPLPAKVTWQHGWMFEPICHPKILIGTSPSNHTRFVATERIAEMTREHWNRDNVHPAGMPFLYAIQHRIKRIPNSLIVCPPHSLPYTKHKWHEREYVDYIRSTSKSFRVVAACVSKACLEQDLWKKEFERAGIPVIEGASAYDRNAIQRMHKLFSSFEYMTTNCIGSHIVYAAYCGSKVSISGPFQELDKDGYKQDPWYIENPDVLDANVLRSSKESVRKHYPDLFIEPQYAPTRVDWAARELGLTFKLSAEKIASLIGWPYELPFHKKLQNYMLNQLKRAYHGTRN